LIEELRVRDIPRELREEIAKYISDFAVGFVKLRDTPLGEDAELAGSGTLVQIDDFFGILTAYHVLKNLPQSGEIGLLLSTRSDPQLHAPKIKVEMVKKIKIAYGNSVAKGPDIGFLLLQSVEVGWIKAIKSFYNLSLRREKLLTSAPNYQDGVWFLCGFAAERTSEEPEAGFSKVKIFRGDIGAGGIIREFSADDFDYLDFEARYGGINEAPESFQGYSGGGIWQAPLLRGRDGKLSAKEIILSGVAFHETGRTENRNVITCHGRCSVYRQAIECVKGNAS
jgi:hypothetical protein